MGLAPVRRTSPDPPEILGIQFAAQDTIGRIATRLIELGERYGDRTDEGIEIRLPITQEDLGGWPASSRASVTAALKTMRELGWIKTERRRIVVLDLSSSDPTDRKYRVASGSEGSGRAPTVAPTTSEEV